MLIPAVFCVFALQKVTTCSKSSSLKCLLSSNSLQAILSTRPAPAVLATRFGG
jgi:hypothetical protein